MKKYSPVVTEKPALVGAMLVRTGLLQSGCHQQCLISNDGAICLKDDFMIRIETDRYRLVLETGCL